MQLFCFFEQKKTSVQWKTLNFSMRIMFASRLSCPMTAHVVMSDVYRMMHIADKLAKKMKCVASPLASPWDSRKLNTYLYTSDSFFLGMSLWSFFCVYSRSRALFFVGVVWCVFLLIATVKRVKPPVRQRIFMLFFGWFWWWVSDHFVKYI